MEFVKFKDFIREGKSNFSSDQLRWWARHGEKTGFNSCLRRVGRHIYIRPDLFYEWLDSQKMKPLTYKKKKKTSDEEIK